MTRSPIDPAAAGAPHGRDRAEAADTETQRSPRTRPHGHLVVKSWRDRWNPDAGGAEVWLDEVVRRLAARGWRVTVLTMAYEGRPRNEVVDGVRYVRHGGVFSQYGLAHLSQWHLHDPADVVLDVFNGVGFLSSVDRRRPTVVVVHHVHREQWPMVFGPRVGRIGWFLEHRVTAALQRGSRHVTVSQASATAIAEAYGIDPARISIAHNGFTPPPPVTPAELVRADYRLVTLGRLVPHKRIEVAIEAVGRARSVGLDVHLDVVGDGEWRGDLVEHARRRDVADHVTFHGMVADERKHAILAASDLMLLPSVREGWGIVVTEAAQHGVPTVAVASAGGVTESVVNGITGELAADAEDLLRRTMGLLADEDRRDKYGREARDRADRFTWEACADTVEATLAAAIAEHDG